MAAGDLRSFYSAIVQVCGQQSIVDEGHLRIGCRLVRCGVFPIGVDVDGVQEEAASARDTDSVKRMMESLQGRRLVIGVDRLDYSKGLVERFNAYERFLETTLLW